MARALLFTFSALLIPRTFAQAGLCSGWWCPPSVPSWPATWALENSTICQPCNNSGLLTPASMARYQIVDVDWSLAKDVWVQGHPMDAESPLIQQAALLTAANPYQKVWVYKNIVSAYPWFPSIREKLLDPAYEGWFLKFGAPPFANGSYHSPPCDANYNPPLCSTFYHSQDQTPNYPKGDGVCPAPACDCGGVPCGFYLFNHANASLRDWIIDVYVMGPTGTGAPGVSGVYLDDRWVNSSSPVDAPDCAFNAIGGPTEVNSGCDVDMGLSQANTTAITDGYHNTMLLLQQKLLAAGKFSWAYFTQLGGGGAGARLLRSLFPRERHGNIWPRADDGAVQERHHGVCRCATRPRLFSVAPRPLRVDWQGVGGVQPRGARAAARGAGVGRGGAAGECERSGAGGV